MQTKKGLSAITVSFNEALDPASAQNVGRYSVLASVKKRGKTVFSKRLGIRGVSYNNMAGTVTINLAKPYKGVVQVTVLGGIAAANGTTSGGNFSAIVK